MRCGDVRCGAVPIILVENRTVRCGADCAFEFHTVQRGGVRFTIVLRRGAVGTEHSGIYL